MTETNSDTDQENLTSPLQQITFLLRKYKLVEGLVNLQESPDLSLSESTVLKQNLTELTDYLNQLHPADIAFVLEALPLEDRLLIWSLVKAELDGLGHGEDRFRASVKLSRRWKSGWAAPWASAQ